MGDPSNLSREFRALVTAIRGPLEDELADRSAPAARRERLKTLHRNFMRLLQLMNTLFDVAEGGPVRRVGSELVDAGAETLIIPTLRDSTSLRDTEVTQAVEPPGCEPTDPCMLAAHERDHP